MIRRKRDPFDTAALWFIITVAVTIGAVIAHKLGYL